MEKSSACKLSFNCATLVAPINTEETPGRLATQLTATCAMLRPSSFATLSNSATMRKFRSVNFSNAGLPEPATASPASPEPCGRVQWRYRMD